MSSSFHNLTSEKETKSCLAGLETTELMKLGALHTATEILQQPWLWNRIYELALERRNQLEAFINQAFEHPTLRIILTGAGSSAFIGNVLEGPLQQSTGKSCSAIATTELISHPAHHFTSHPTLLVSFARSGDSPESLAAAQLAASHCTTLYHLIITCNPNGKLASDLKNGVSHVFLLPSEADDKSLAMTGSFTGMLLSGLLICRIHELTELKETIQQLCTYGKTILNSYCQPIKEIASLPFDRAVFLGSGPMKAIANESELKVQELTDGKIVCKFDSFLGFRHGPRAVVHPHTLLVYLFSNNPYVNQYETDLVTAINSGEKGICRIGLEESNNGNRPLDLHIQLGNESGNLEEVFLCICAVLPAQLLAFFKSIQLGLQPDNPSKNQAITRVVKGVTIYPYYQTIPVNEIH
ncbi:SIS domain-containing protein [Flavihumibacter sp. UBA7668]|uniref:SIS domain-containing protein n=1 Tax=Flavihumibacter sp. UBA7668 TaxID=1946542 RepID=UPI0025C6AC28|nr:SIS domain-containing protein [Flavihumibacter sp. UBA7668]